MNLCYCQYCVIYSFYYFNYFSFKGKTILASESVRCSSLLHSVFPDGVYWLNFGKMSDSTNNVDKSALLKKVQDFILKMDGEKHHFDNLESAKNHLQVK